MSDIRATVYEGTRIGFEDIEGQTVPASNILYSTGFELSRQGESRQYKRPGSKYNSLSYMTKRWSGGSVSGELAYADFVYLCLALIGDATAITEVETGVYDWLFDIRDDRKDNPKSLTIERGSNAGAERVPGAFLTGLTVTSSRSESTISGDIMGKIMEQGVQLTGDAIYRVTLTGATGGTFTLSVKVGAGSAQVTAPITYNATAAAITTAIEALSNVAVGDIDATGGPANTTPVTLTFSNTVGSAPITLVAVGTSLTGTTPSVVVTTVQAGIALTEIDPIVVLPGDVAYFLFTDLADINAPQDEHYLDEGYSLEIALSGKYGPRWTVDRRQKSYKGKVELGPDFTGTLVVGKGSNDAFGDDDEIAADYLTSRLGDNEIAYLQLSAVGEEIGATSKYELAYTVAIRPEEASDEDTDGVSTLSFPLQNVVSPDWGRRAGQIRVRVPFGTV